MPECPDSNTGGKFTQVDSPVAFSNGHGRDGHPCEAILRGLTHVRAQWGNMDVDSRQRRQPSHDKARDRWYRRYFTSTFRYDFGYISRSGSSEIPRNTSIKSG
jgi:hypothetical protein